MNTEKFYRDITHGELLDILNYDPSTGFFHWRVRRRGIRLGMRAGGFGSLGYWYVGINYKRYLAHRLAWLYVHGRWPHCVIDHIDGHPGNNAFENLREADQHQNQQNTIRKGFYKKRRSFSARINVRGKGICLGCFPSEEKAREAYLTATQKYFGEFSVVNSGRVSALDFKEPRQ